MSVFSASAPHILNMYAAVRFLKTTHFRSVLANVGASFMAARPLLYLMLVMACLLGWVVPVQAQFGGGINHSNWWRNGATLDLDFRQDRYWLNGVSYTGIANLIAVSGVNYSRTGSATYVDASGTVQTVAANVPRLTWETSGTGVPLGLLSERAETNFLVRSEEFDSGSWIKQSSVSVTANAGIAPNGLMTADLLTTDGGGDNVRQVATLTSGTTYTFSVFAKHVSGLSRLALFVNFSSWNDSTNRSVSFDLVSKTVATGIPSGISAARIEPYADNWSRLSITFTPEITNSSTGPIMSAGFSGLASFLKWGAQLEEANYPTSYIPTVGSTVTRGNDVFQILDTAGGGGWLNSSAGTLLGEAFRSGGRASIQNRMIALSHPSNGEWVLMFVNGGNVSQCRIDSLVDVTSTIVYNTNVAAVTQPAVIKLGCAYAADNFRGAANATLLALDTSGAAPTDLTRLEIGTGGGGSAFRWDDTIQRVTYFPTREPDHTLTDYTR
jgi:hypothetical protein